MRNLVPASTSVPRVAPYAPEQRRAIPLFADKEETTMTTKTRLSALVLAAAAFTTITLAAGGSAAAKILRPLPGHGPVTSIDGKPVAGQAGSEAPPNPFPPGGGASHGNSGSSGGLVSCHPITGCTVTSGNGDHDHDPGHGHDHGGYYHDRWYGWRDRPEIVVEGVPAAVAVPAPVQAVSAGVSVPAAPAAAAPCNCLTKQNLPDGSVLFQDICTKESAIAAPQTVGAR
jgi:hypothetical protein